MSKNLKITLFITIALVLLTAAFMAGYSLHQNQSSDGQSTSTAAGQINTRLIGQEAWEIITRNYVLPVKINATEATQGAIRGLVQSLNDPWSVYLDPDAYKLQEAHLQGSFGGIGATVGADKDNQIQIVSTVKGAPAEKAGLKAGDLILAVDDNSTSGKSITEVVLEIRGTIGTSVKLLILHEGDNRAVEVTLQRAEITTPSVSSEMKGDIAYIAITSFDARTESELQSTMQSLDLAHASGIILDLRNNPGGYVYAVANVASHLIKQNVIMIQKDNQGNLTPVPIHTTDSAIPLLSKPIFTDLPVVVLVNEFSASGSEVLSGALQDYQRATVAGTQTRGKGSYGQNFMLSDGSAIYLTVGRWLTPNRREIEGIGITPDVVLTQTGDEATQWAIDFLHNNK